MYIKQLEKWTDSDWNRCFRHNNIDDRNGPEIRQILTLDSKEAIESNFDKLKELGVLNGIGASWMGKYVVAFITALFKGVRFEFHDIAYFLGGSKQNKLDADYGLFKYSIITILNNFRQINKLDVNFIFKFVSIWGYAAFAVIQFIICFVFWQILVCCGGKAFYFHN